MDRKSTYYPLRWVVQVRDTYNQGWETMAAFNVDSVAKQYADECYRSNLSNSYRVMERVARGFRGPIHERFTINKRKGALFGTMPDGSPAIIIG